jgi:anti-sigma B factor antagonist
MNFTITTEQEGPIAVISLTGEVDLYTAPEFKAELVKVIEGRAEHVVVDLSDTSFIDSTTLGVLISGVKRLGPRNGRLVLVITDRNIRKIFDITGLDRVFPIFEERERALADLRSAAGDLPRPD